MKINFLKLIMFFLIIILSASSFYVFNLLKNEEKPIATIKTKAASKTYKRILALNNTTPTTLIENNQGENNNSQTTSVPTPTIDQASLSPTMVVDNQTPTEIPTPTSINLVTTPIITEEGRELAYNNPTITLENSTPTLTSQKTKTQTLPETGFYQVLVGIILFSLLVIIFALVI